MASASTRAAIECHSKTIVRLDGGLFTGPLAVLSKRVEAVVGSTAVYEARPFLLLELTKCTFPAHAIDMMI